MANYDRQPDTARYPTGRLPAEKHRGGPISRNKPPVRIPLRRGLEKVRLTETRSRLRLAEDRRVKIAKAAVAITALLACAAFIAYVGYDPQIDRIGIYLALGFLGICFVLPALIVFFVAIPVTRCLELDTEDQHCRYWWRYLGFPIRTGRYLARDGGWTSRPHLITTRGEARQSNLGCLVGILGPIGALASGVMMLTDHEPDRQDMGLEIVLIVGGQEQLHFVIFDQPAGHEFVRRAQQLTAPTANRD